MGSEFNNGGGIPDDVNKVIKREKFVIDADVRFDTLHAVKKNGDEVFAAYYYNTSKEEAIKVAEYEGEVPCAVARDALGSLFASWIEAKADGYGSRIAREAELWLSDGGKVNMPGPRMGVEGMPEASESNFDLAEFDEENLDPDYPYLVHILNVDEVEEAAEALVKALMDEDDVDDGTVEKMIRMLIEDEVGPIGCKTEKSAKKLAAKLLCGGIHTEIKSPSGDDEDDAIF